MIDGMSYREVKENVGELIEGFKCDEWQWSWMRVRVYKESGGVTFS